MATKFKTMDGNTAAAHVGYAMSDTTGGREANEGRVASA